MSNFENAFAPNLSEIQALCRHGFNGFSVACYVFFEITNPSLFREALSSRLRCVPASDTRVQAIEAESLWQFAFTWSGLCMLGCTHIDGFSSEFREGPAQQDRARILGDVGDDAPDKWEFGMESTLHGLAMCYATTKQRAFEDAELFGKSVHIISTELGQLPDDLGDSVREHFGFRDGLAKPSFGLNGVAPGELVLGFPDSRGQITFGPLLAKGADSRNLLMRHASGRPDFGWMGSYLVYRKLHQDVAAFWDSLMSQARARWPEDAPQRARWLAAKLVGRWPDGTPAVDSPDKPAKKPTDDLTYRGDPVGLKCPIGAHVRRMNSRDALPFRSVEESLAESARRSIFRRGRPYGEPLFNLHSLDPLDADLKFLEQLKDDGKPRGLHFLGLCTSLRDQFEFLQQTWANSPVFGGLRSNPDPLIGRSPERLGTEVNPQIPTHDETLLLRGWSRPVRTLAACYFFLPGVRALRFLAH